MVSDIAIVCTQLNDFRYYYVTLIVLFGEPTGLSSGALAIIYIYWDKL